MSRWRRTIVSGLVVAAVATTVTSFADPVAAFARRGGNSTPAPDCGPTISKTLFSRWQCTFADDFNNTTVDASKWTVEQTSLYGYHSGAECFTDRPGNVSEGNGVLSLTVRREAAPFTCTRPLGNYTTQYTSGMVMSIGHFSQTYGRFEVRAKLPAQTMAGLQETFWLWPTDSRRYGTQWPASGEIDWAEFYSNYADRVVPYVHYDAAAPDANITNQNCVFNDPAGFHTYTLVWTPSTLTIGYDGATCVVDDWNPAAPLTGSQPFDQPFFVNLTQALGIGKNAFDPATTILPATTQIDYMRVWR